MARRDLQNCRTIVTGASAGIGRALALALLEQGARVVLTARSVDLLEKLVQESARPAAQFAIVPGDITYADVRAACLDAAMQKWGGLDLVINNAGIGATGRFDEAQPERLRQIMEVNFFAAVELIRAALPLLKNGTRPIVVNIGSILGHRGIPFASEYCASKFALRGISESLRAELTPLGIDLLLVSPGTTQTDFFDHAIERGEYPWRDSRAVTPEYVARCTLRAIRKGKTEIIPSFPGRMMVRLSRWVPGLFDRVMRRYG